MSATDWFDEEELGMHKSDRQRRDELAAIIAKQLNAAVAQARRETRRDALEEAAKTASNRALVDGNADMKTGYSLACKNIASEIRLLKENSDE